MQCQDFDQYEGTVGDFRHHLIDFDEEVGVEMIAKLDGFGAESKELKWLML